MPHQHLHGGFPLFSKFPLEVRYEIFLQMPDEQMRQCRVICKSWNQEIQKLLIAPRFKDVVTSDGKVLGVHHCFFETHYNIGRFSSMINYRATRRDGSEQYLQLNVLPYWDQPLTTPGIYAFTVNIKFQEKVVGMIEHRQDGIVCIKDFWGIVARMVLTAELPNVRDLKTKFGRVGDKVEVELYWGLEKLNPKSLIWQP